MMISEILQAFLLIFIAEMGDKTQILAMAFATKYSVKKVLLGIGIGSFLNHGLAVLLGSCLSNVIPINTLQMMAGFAFVGFALWTLKADEEEDDDEQQKIQFGPVATVSLAFFLGELGDKTQLAAITLATGAIYPIMILVGTVSGMIATGALGIVVGKKMEDKIPELDIKLFAATMFMFFGIQKLLQTIPTRYQKMEIIIPFVLTIGTVATIMIIKLFIQRKKGIQSAFVVQLKLLQDYYEHIEKDLENTCMGLEYCGECKGSRCALGHAKEVVSLAKSNEELLLFADNFEGSYKDKPFEKNQIIDSLVDTLWLIKSISDENKLKAAHEIRRKLELILFGHDIEVYKNINDYKEQMNFYNKEVSRIIVGYFNIRKPIRDRILNIGGKVNNIYLVEILEGYLLIDTGYKEQYEGFCKALTKEKVEFNEIKYVFITHAHDDHVGFLNQILNKTDAKIILHKEAVSRLRVGQNSFEGGCSSRIAWLFCKIIKLFGKRKYQFDVVDSPDRYQVLSDENKCDLEKILTAKIIELPGHTSDSIGLLFNDEILVCGDAFMNGFPSRSNIIIWIENTVRYKATWEKMIEMNYEMVYPSHGRPFSKDKIKSNQKKLKSIRQLRLT